MDFFEIFAECAIAFTGFAAVHAALQGSDSPRGVMRAWTVVSHGALAFILSILPLLFSLTSLPDQQIWLAASGVGLLATAAALCMSLVVDARMTRLGHPPQATLNLRIGQLSTLVAVLAMALNVAGWPWPTDALLHGVSVVLILASGLLALLHSFLIPLQRVLNP